MLLTVTADSGLLGYHFATTFLVVAATAPVIEKLAVWSAAVCFFLTKFLPEAMQKGTRSVRQLTEGLPSIHVTLDSIPSTECTGHGGPCLYPST